MFNWLRSFVSEVFSMQRMAADSTSYKRYCADLFISRIRKLGNLSSLKTERQIKLKGGVILAYRPQGGDLWSIREVWLEEAYRLPAAAKVPATVIDLGANIGNTSVWLAKRYGCKRFIAVEPSVTNARLARENFKLNGISGNVIEAAVGPSDGVTFFQEEQESNIGRIGQAGTKTRMLSMQSLLQELPPECAVDLLKIDIEGSEEALLTKGDISWLGRVNAIIIECHPQLIDYPALVASLQAAGFRHFPSGTAHMGSMDYFTREHLGS
jgi:FkbM family methyltransferase